MDVTINKQNVEVARGPERKRKWLPWFQ